VYQGYENRFYQWNSIEGIRVLRVKTYVTANEGFLKRTLNYISYMVSAIVFSPLVRQVDVVVSTSPQFFCGMAGYFVSRLKRKKWILEIRDLWPEGIVALGALKQRQVIAVLEALERFLYIKADHIVVVTHAFKGHIIKKGVPPDHITVITNGVDIEAYQPLPRDNDVSRRYGFEGKFLVSYIGNHGMSQALSTALRAAKMLENERDILFLLVGDGAERETLLKEKERLNLTNLLMLPLQPKDKMPQFLAASDACMVLLRKDDLFKSIIPSKIFEIMAMERPIIIGVDGESREIIEAAESGVFAEPENHEQLAQTVLKLSRDREYLSLLGANGRKYVIQHYNRDSLANVYLKTLSDVYSD
jgi:glycosyltransferase involved in cell wall biosynthesis